MNATQAIRTIFVRSKMKMRTASLMISNNPTWISSRLAKSENSRADVVAKIARTCGYVLCLVPSKDVPKSAVLIDPTPSNKKQEDDDE